MDLKWEMGFRTILKQKREQIFQEDIQLFGLKQSYIRLPRPLPSMTARFASVYITRSTVV